ncbi:unnamed protein product [Effrenium voratum]|nr:unnamed protein product [Effrenium voratum]
MQVHVYLPSGKGCSLTVSPEWKVYEVKAEAQRQLKRCCLSLAFGGQQLDPSCTLSDSGLQDGDSIAAIAQPIKLASTRGAFALVVEGAVRTWGNPGKGGVSDRVEEKLVHVRHIQGSDKAFAAILESGSVVTWGQCVPLAQGQLLPRGQQIQAASNAFAVIQDDGSASTFDDGSLELQPSNHVQAQLVRVQQIQASHRAFAAIRDDGSVVTWGNPDYGGDSSQVQKRLAGVHQIQATEAFAAIRADGSVVTWGNPHSGADSSHVREQLVQVHQIQATERAFAAIRADGSVVTWGNPHSKGSW